MREVLNNIELKGPLASSAPLRLASSPYIAGTAMGSQRELTEATDFIAKHNIVPVVSDILEGLESFEEGFEAMQRGSQFGKIVIRMRKNNKGKL